MLTPKFVAVYGTIGLAVMVVLLALIFFKLVPAFLYLPFFVVAILLFVGRIVMRIILVRQEKRAKSEANVTSPPDHTRQL
jgi:hypothetical protein